MPKTYYVYILASSNHRALYTGVTGNLPERLDHHRNGEGSAFTARYRTHKLVYAEPFDSVDQAIDWEKTIKAGSRQKKIDLIEGQNPEWMDLSENM